MLGHPCNKGIAFFRPKIKYVLYPCVSPQEPEDLAKVERAFGNVIAEGYTFNPDAIEGKEINLLPRQLRSPGNVHARR